VDDPADRRHLRDGGPIDALARLCAGADRWPRPAGGRTARRWLLLAAAARRDLILGRLVEAHADALAICAELDYPAAAGRRWGVWAAGPPASVTARLVDDEWRLNGIKSWCSGASLLSHALIDASAPDGQRLFAVGLRQSGVTVLPAEWEGPGMQGADTRSVALDEVPADPVGPPGSYLTRPGFWIGAIGVAACWRGGTGTVAAPLYEKARRTGAGDSLLLAHLGAVHTALAESSAALRGAAGQVDRRPTADHSLLALTVRQTVERNAVHVIDHVGRALGPAPLAHDRRHAATVADLTVYIRQHHGDRDLAEIGRRIAERDR
jgi:alkylation response protein AidB-like acyl-CoA dehydrogenase